jgi:transposase
VQLRGRNKNIPLTAVIAAWLKGGFRKKVGIRTFYHVCEREGYRWRQVVRKGILSAEDRKMRLTFAREMASEGPQFWTGICFFLDCVSFLYKRNPEEDARTPKGRVWMKREERVKFSGKSKNIGVGGRLLHLCVGISYGRGVVFCHPYAKMTGEVFAGIVKRFFGSCRFSPTKMFLQDNDPSQNSAAAVAAVLRAGFTQVRIPPRSPDLNPIENLFACVKRELRFDAVERGLQRESFGEFEKRVVATLKRVGAKMVDNLILSMPKRIHLIVKGKGERLPY